MNKGLAIRKKKLEKNAEKRMAIKPHQELICQFVTIRWEVIEKVNGKYKRTGNTKANGLQIKNRVYLPNGKYKLINNKSVKLLNSYDGIPEWSNDYLTDLYESHVKKGVDGNE